jgi:hypothetical protein
MVISSNPHTKSLQAQARNALQGKPLRSDFTAYEKFSADNQHLGGVWGNSWGIEIG